MFYVFLIKDPTFNLMWIRPQERQVWKMNGITPGEPSMFTDQVILEFLVAFYCPLTCNGELNKI